MTLEERIKAIREIGEKPTNRISKMKKRITELKAQIEKMKCCGNCENKDDDSWHDSPCDGCENYTHWELRR